MRGWTFLTLLLCVGAMTTTIGWRVGSRMRVPDVCRESVAALEVDALQASCPPGATLHVAPVGPVAVVLCSCPMSRPIDFSGLAQVPSETR